MKIKYFWNTKFTKIQLSDKDVLSNMESDKIDWIKFVFQIIEMIIISTVFMSWKNDPKILLVFSPN